MEIKIAEKSDVEQMALSVRNANRLGAALKKAGYKYVNVNGKLYSTGSHSKTITVFYMQFFRAVDEKAVSKSSPVDAFLVSESIKGIVSRLDAIEKRLSFPVVADVQKKKKCRTVDFSNINRDFEKQRIGCWLSGVKGSFTFNDAMVGLGYVNEIQSKKRAAYYSLVSTALAGELRAGRIRYSGTKIVPIGRSNMGKKKNIYVKVDGA